MTEEEHLHPQVHTCVCTLKHIHAHTCATFKHTEFLDKTQEIFGVSQDKNLAPSNHFFFNNDQGEFSVHGMPLWL